MISGSCLITLWRCPRMGSSRRPARRSSALSRRTQTTRTLRMRFAHVCYENGEPDTARTYLSSWLATYPRDGFFYGHLSWHLSLCEIQAGNWAEAMRLYRDAIALDRHSGGPQQKISDGAAFLWRSELAGHPRNVSAWRGLYDYANTALPRPA